VRGDEHVVGANHHAPSLEVGAVERRFLIRIHRLDLRQKCRQRRHVVCVGR
jgi:hypothetical protein